MTKVVYKFMLTVRASDTAPDDSDFAALDFLLCLVNVCDSLWK